MKTLISRLADRLVVAIIERALAIPATREVIIDCVVSSKELGSEIAGEVDDAVDKFERDFSVRVGEVDGLEDEIDERVDKYATRHLRIDASRVEDLEEFIEAGIDRELNKRGIGAGAEAGA